MPDATRPEQKKNTASDKFRQFVFTPAAGKRLIARGVAAHPSVKRVLQSGTMVIVAGTTNACVAEEILGSEAGFKRGRFFRGITLPPGRKVTDSGRLADESAFPGDVILEKGKWLRGKTIFDVVDGLKEGDLIIKGANALDPIRNRAAVLIGDPKGGTLAAALQAVVGRRVELLLPVGLEKRVTGDLDDLALMLNAPGAEGTRLWPAPGTVFTELDAIALLTGARAELIAAGGIGGAEGCVRLAVLGTAQQLETMEKIHREIGGEPAFEV
jgi:hypothetical protein